MDYFIRTKDFVLYINDNYFEKFDLNSLMFVESEERETIFFYATNKVFIDGKLIPQTIYFELKRHQSYRVLKDDFINAEELQKLLDKEETEAMAIMLIRNELFKITNK